MAKMKALRKDEDLALIPLDQPVMVDLEPEGSEVEEPDDPKPIKGAENTGANVLEEQLKALQEANRIEKDKRLAAERRAEESDRERVAAVNSQSRTESDAVQSGLQAAQAEQAAAKLALKQAGESGDWDAVGEANARIGRAASDIREFERSAAMLADRNDQVQEQPRQVRPDIMTAIDGNPQLLATEKDWLKLHPEAYSTRNKELDVAYDRAMRKGLSRGTPDYFKFMDEFMGYTKPVQTEDDDAMSVSAPVSRNERGGDGRPSNGKIMLSPEQREIAKSMGVTDTEYARQVAVFEQRRKDEPEKYGGSR